MNDRGILYLFELGIGLVLVMGLMTSLQAPPQEPDFGLKIRICTDLAGVWTYDQGSLEDAIELLGVEGRIMINPSEHKEIGYECTAQRIKWGLVEAIRIRVQ